MEAEDANGLGLWTSLHGSGLQSFPRLSTADLLPEPLALRRTSLSVPDKHGASFQRGAAECKHIVLGPWADFLRHGSRHTRQLLQEFSSLACNNLGLTLGS